jgi:hypothetical protein
MQLSVIVILLLHIQYPHHNYNFAEKIIQPTNNMMIKTTIKTTITTTTSQQQLQHPYKNTSARI